MLRSFSPCEFGKYYQPLQMLLINRNKRYRQQQQQLARGQNNLKLDDPKPIRRCLSLPRTVLGKGPFFLLFQPFKSIQDVSSEFCSPKWTGEGGGPLSHLR
jgi:hypothetical protein